MFFALIIAITLYGLFGRKATVVEAAPGDVIINELMYNPGTGNQDDEYIELYNTTAAPINLENWSFSSGINYTFGAVTIPANGYVVIACNAGQFISTYGFAPAPGQYAPTNLSNGGETVTLVDDTATEIDSVSYDDTSPWPTSPDGSGPSLELRDPTFDNSVATNWSASINSGGTPLAQNSVVGLTPPTIADVTDPNDVAASQDVTVTANVTGVGITAVNLKYKLNFGSDVTVAMLDDGNNNDGSAGDNVYGATIPGQAIDTLVRFRVEATNGSGTFSSPSNNDSINYHGYAIIDPLLTSEAELFHWYMDDTDYDDMINNHVFDDVYLPAVVVYGNEVFDNTLVRVKGEFSRTFTKKSFKFKLPSGYKIGIDGGSNREINEFHMNAEYKSATLADVQASWWLLDQVGLPTPDILPLRVQKNGEFQGMYLFAEKYETEWRQEKGYNDGLLFEDYWEVVVGPNDLTPIQDWESNMMRDNQDPVKRDYMLDNNDIPGIFNFMSAQALLSSWDHFIDTNTFSHRDGDTGRWSLFYWDLDSTLGVGNRGAQFVSPYDYSDARSDAARFPTTALYNESDIRAMYMRRLRTLVDKLYATDAFLNKYNEFADKFAPEMLEDVTKWPADVTIGQRRERIWEVQSIERIKRNLLAHLVQPWAIPASQTQAEKESVFIEEAVPNVNNANEYIKISNNSSAHVDISNWRLDEIDYTIPAGSVVPANGSIYFVRDDSGYRAVNPSVFIFGQYTNDLNDGGGTLTLKTDQNQDIDTHAY